MFHPRSGKLAGKFGNHLGRATRGSASDRPNVRQFFAHGYFCERAYFGIRAPDHVFGFSFGRLGYNFAAACVSPRALGEYNPTIPNLDNSIFRRLVLARRVARISGPDLLRRIALVYSCYVTRWGEVVRKFTDNFQGH